jgi:outer membrane beta-barrel protein
MRARLLLLCLAALAAAPARAAEAGAPADALTGADTADVQLVHAIERRPFTEAGRWELSAFAPVQVNSLFTFHAGAALELAYHLRENLAVQVGVLWNPVAIRSGLAEEMVTKVSQEPLAAETLLLQGAVLAGLELMPVYGKISLFDGRILRFGIYLNAGLGAGQTRLELRPADQAGGRTFGAVGPRLVGGLGLGARAFLTERFTLRLELRDLVYSAYVSRVNGCNLDDAKKIQSTGASAPVSAGCDPGAFGDTAKEIKENASHARWQLDSPSADVLNNLAAYAGLSYLF